MAPTAAVQADEILFQLPPGAGVGENWLCRAEADSQGSWFIRCEDLVEVFNYDPVLTNATEPQVATRIPLYGAPYHDSDLDGLASAVLCNQAPACRVALAMR